MGFFPYAKLRYSIRIIVAHPSNDQIQFQKRDQMRQKNARWEIIPPICVNFGKRRGIAHVVWRDAIRTGARKGRP